MEDEQKLFIRVIIQLIEDYTIDSPVAANKAESVIAKQDAIEWFTRSSKDYRMTCEFAGIHPDWLRTKVLNSDKEQLKRLINEYRRII